MFKNALKLLIIILALAAVTASYSQDDKVKSVVSSMPDEMAAGSTITVSITYTNNGSQTWSNQDFEVKETGPFDVTRSNELVWSLAPGESKTKEYQVTAPDKPGSYKMRIAVYHKDKRIAYKTKKVSVTGSSLK